MKPATELRRLHRQIAAIHQRRAAMEARERELTKRAVALRCEIARAERQAIEEEAEAC